jgi:Carboxypeptidase regulatory-like domain
MRDTIPPRLFLPSLGIVCLLVAACASAFGQNGNATISGIVQDPSSSIVVGAQVVATNTSTGVARTAVTSGAGFYLIQDLIPGSYVLEVSAQGFRATRTDNVRLNVDQQARLDVKLEIGSATQDVKVTDDVDLLQTSDASVGTVVDSQQVQTLPLNGRFITQLLELTPGTVPSSYSNGLSNPGDVLQSGHERNGQPAFDVNGQNGGQTYFRLDGLNNNERMFGGSNIPISVDAVQEFKLQTSNFSAEYGGSSTQVDVVTKSGTNAIHGSLFEFLRNDDLDAAQWVFEGPAVKNDLKRNQFGGAIGGPIKKDKLFYFFSYDGTREVFSQPFLETVPTADMRNGIFPAGDIIFNPATQQPFPNNTIPQSQWNAISGAILPYIPAANRAGTPQTSAAGLPLPPTSNYLYTPSRTQTINQYNGRVDYTLSDRNSYFVRYTNSSNLVIGDGPLATNLNGSIIGFERANVGGTNLTGGWFHTFSNSKINQFSAGLSTDPQDYAKGDTTNYASKFGLSSLLYPNADSGFPHIIIGSLNLGSGDNRPLKVGETNYQVADALTIIKGAHSLSIGGYIRRANLTTANNNDSTGIFDFNGAQTYDRNFPGTGNTYCPGSTDPTSCNAGNGFADFLLGDLASSLKGTPVQTVHKYNSNWAPYVNDSWRVRRDLTLNVGLRYEYQTRIHASPPFYSAPIIENNQFTGMIAVANQSNGAISPLVLPGALALIPGSVETCRQAGLPDNCQVSQKYGWQPRFGFAWQAHSTTVLRGGFGVYWGQFKGDGDIESCEGYPLALTDSTQTYTAPPSGNAPPPLNFSNPFNGAAPAAPSYGNCSAPHRKLPQTYQWNLTGEQAFGPNTTVSLGYVASVSRHLDQAVVGGQAQYNIPEPYGVVLGPNQQQQVPVPAFGNVGQYLSVDNANYNSLQANLRRRLSQGLSLNVSYTFAKSLGTESWFSDPRNYKVDYGPLPNDLRSVATITPIWQLPFGTGQRFAHSNKIADKAVGGWTVSTIIDLRSGFPFNPVMVGTDVLHLNGNINEDRPDQVCSGRLSHPTATEWYDGTCFVYPTEPTAVGASLRQGDTGINSLRGPRATTEDLGISKTTAVTERTVLEFRAELFNVWNHTVLGLPNYYNSPFSTPNTTITYVDALPRVIQFALKLKF